MTANHFGNHPGCPLKDTPAEQFYSPTEKSAQKEKLLKHIYFLQIGEMRLSNADDDYEIPIYQPAA